MKQLRIAASIALLPLIGASPAAPGTPSEAAECRLSYADAKKAADALNITRSRGEDPKAEGGMTKFFNPAGVTVLGQSATSFSRAEFEVEGVMRTMYRVEIPGTYADMRAAMLKLHGKTNCDAHESAEPGKLGCMIHLRDEAGTPALDVDMILLEIEGRVTTGCIYATKP
jgi:hypothetical protein